MNIKKVYLQNTPGLLVNEAGNPFHSSTSSQATDGGLRNSLDVVTENFAMTLRTSLPEPLASFTATRHDDSLKNSFHTLANYHQREIEDTNW